MDRKWARSGLEVSICPSVHPKHFPYLLDEPYARDLQAQGACALRFFSILVEDDAIKPISGHVLRVEAPWIKTTMAKGDAYIIPKYVHH